MNGSKKAGPTPRHTGPVRTRWNPRVLAAVFFVSLAAAVGAWWAFGAKREPVTEHAGRQQYAALQGR